MSGAVPTTTSEITVDWLTDALRASGTIGDDASVASVTVDPQAGGVGFVGEVGKLHLTSDGAPDAPTEMVAKFPTRSPEVQAMLYPTRIFEREHRFYDALASQTPMRTPETYHVTCEVSDDPTAECYFLLMEDLSGLTVGDQEAGVTPEQAESALLGLAAHHATFWNGAGLGDVSLAPLINGPLNRAGQGIYSASLPGFTEVFGSVLRPEMVPVAEAYTEAHPSLLDSLASMPNTLVHFDFRADNLFFDDSGDTGETGGVCVIDWQTISIGGGAADVGYFLSQNLATTDRRSHEDDLLHRYHDTLVANGVTGYDFDQFFHDYRVGIMYGWVIPVFAVGSLDVSSERAMSLWTNVLERVQDAIFQHGAQEFVS